VMQEKGLNYPRHIYVFTKLHSSYLHSFTC